MAIKVLHLNNEALIGRYPHPVVKTLFAEHDVDYVFADEIPKKAYKDSTLLVKYCNENDYDWVYWNWEKHEVNRYKIVYESKRSFKIALLGHEQPQAIHSLRACQQYADIVITTAPTYKDEVDGFLPFGIHTHYFEEKRLPFEGKQNRILVSGSYRHSRGQFFEWLLREQPFDWPVYLFSPNFQKDMVELDLTRQIAARYPKYVYRCAETHKSYISEFLSHLNSHKIFLDFTTNSSNYLKFHEDLQEIIKQGSDLKGGYCPERVLDALWLGTYSWCFQDKAVEYCLENKVGYYSSLDQLVTEVNTHIRNQTLLKEKAQASAEYVKRYTTESVIKHLARLFHSGKLVEI